ncbi:MAG: dTDP-4-dehydrorhamnose 3,5-epimerase [Burkholderiaceae bacterium]
MKVTPTSLPEVLLLEPRVFTDERGYFMESWNQRVFDRAVGRHVAFVQDNHSRSCQGVLRGLHYQLPPHGQGKLVRVTHGRVFDVAVDIRRSSADFGRWTGIELSDANQRQLWIPPGHAHGFLVLSESADFAYKTTEYWFAESDRALRYDDAEIGIDWPEVSCDLVVGAKDRDAPRLSAAEIYP